MLISVNKNQAWGLMVRDFGKIDPDLIYFHWKVERCGL